ncbi:MAG: hypothetical protein LRY63_03070 [Nitrincola sp.]|nr:hypothetical protein [Nitrincola sp.]
MGHWQQGQEPFGRFSSLSPEELFNSLIPVLDEIRKETGWSTQSGLADDI